MPKSEILESIVPRSIIIGESTLSKIPEILGTLRVKPRVMILTGSNTRKIVGEEIYELVSKLGLDSEVMVVKSSSLEAANTYSDQTKSFKPNILIGAGGGKVIDVTKYCLLTHQKKLEMISVPTSTPHDGIASPFIFLNNPTETFIGECRPPLAVIADTSKIIQHPQLLRYLAAGVGDTIGKMTAIWDWRHAWRIKSVKFSRFVTGVLENAGTLLQDQVSDALKDLNHAIQVVLKSLLIAGVLMGTSNDIRVGYGSEHMFSAALDSEVPRSDILHGERVALGTILMAKLQGQNYQGIIQILESAGCPTTIDDLEAEISPEAIVEALKKAHKINPMYTVLGNTGLTENAALNLALSTGVISS
ncbi:MAG: iron-containing alcohol dehydrogenase [Candidatus Hodarchaeales archaeon]